MEIKICNWSRRVLSAQKPQCVCMWAPPSLTLYMCYGVGTRVIFVSHNFNWRWVSLFSSVFNHIYEMNEEMGGEMLLGFLLPNCK